MSGLSIATDIYRLLNVPSVTALLDGSIYKFNRPLNSRLRDVVISVPEYEGQGFSQGKIDVNIHVPNLELWNDQTAPDLVQMEAIVDAILPLLAAYESAIPGVPFRDADGQWYCNIRIGFSEIDDNDSVPVDVFALTAVSDDFGGHTPLTALHWSGIAARVEVKKGSQLGINSGRYTLNLECDWILPLDAAPQHNMFIQSSEGDYVIHGIAQEGQLWRVHSFRKDGSQAVI